MHIFEGGNVFKDKMGVPLTRRIKQAEIPATIKWLESVTGLDLHGANDPATNYPIKWLGSTGKKPDSGDLDLAVELSDKTKPELKAHLDQYVTGQKQDPKDFVRMSGEAVHFKTPIEGDANRGFVQTDFMFMPNIDWGAFFLSGGVDSEYKGMFRNVLMSSIAKSQGLKASAKGVTSRTTDNVITTDPDRAAELLLGPNMRRNNLKNVESIYTALANHPDRDAKLADFREYLSREGVKEPGTVAESETNFLARLRDRIVNQGMAPLIETGSANPYSLYEAEQPGVGGRAKGIEHLEDLVFRHGAAGITQAIEIAQHATEQPRTVTAKWDGKPAVIWGRKPATGEFVLTDGSGFEAKGYDGLATSPAMMADIQNRRGPNREGLINIYRQLWPVLEASLPSNFRGYVKGDLLYMDTPQVEAGNYVFRPNTVTYKIPVKSALGQRIGNSKIGVAVHSMYADVGDARQPLSRITFNEVPGLMLERPATPTSLELNQNIVKQLKTIVRSQGNNMKVLFNPVELRAQQVTDLFKLAVDFINTKVGGPLEPANQLIVEFGQWLQGRVTPRKFNNIVEYLKNPGTNQEALAAAFLAFELLHELKVDILRQADVQHPGQEGWVMATPAGYAKAVSRFDPNAFAAVNRAQNNPK